MAGDLKRDSAHFSFLHVPVESMVSGHVDVRWLQDHQALLTQPVVLIFMGRDSAGLVQGEEEMKKRLKEKEMDFLILKKSWSSFAHPVHCSTLTTNADQQMALLHCSMSLHIICMSTLAVCKFNVVRVLANLLIHYSYICIFCAQAYSELHFIFMSL